MTPKEKAEQLVEIFMNIKQQKLADYSIIYHPTAKQCALIAVDEILKLEQARLIVGSHNYYDYYIEVKQEIENL
jgi:hypothetical protein